MVGIRVTLRKALGSDPDS